MSDSVKITTIEDMVYIRTPYNKEFIRSIKTIPQARWSPSKKAWVIPEKYREVGEQVVEKYFPKERTSRLLAFDVKSSGERFSIDGRWIMAFNRDWIKFFPDEDTDIVDDTYISPGGSRKHPKWNGRFIVRHRGAPEITYCCDIDGVIQVEGSASEDPQVAMMLQEKAMNIEAKEPMITELKCKDMCSQIKHIGHTLNACKFTEQQGIKPALCLIQSGKEAGKKPPLTRTELVSPK